MTISQPLVSLIVPSYNGGKDVLECLHSIFDLDFKDFEVILVDNGSTDDSARVAGKSFPEIKVIHLDRNVGYGKAVNFGIANSKGLYVGFLDNDVAVSLSWLSELLRVIEVDDTIGIVGGLVYAYSTGNIVYNGGGLVDMRNGHVRVLGVGLRDFGQFRGSRQVDWVSGASILVRRQLLERVGFFDEGYVFYRDEVDLCVKARCLGYRVMFTHRAVSWHKGSSTMTRMGLKFYYLYRSWIRFVIIHVKRRYLLQAVLSVVLITLAKSVEAILKGNRFALQQAFGAIWWNIVFLPSILRSRMNRYLLGAARLQ